MFEGRLHQEIPLPVTWISDASCNSDSPYNPKFFASEGGSVPRLKSATCRIYPASDARHVLSTKIPLDSTHFKWPPPEHHFKDQQTEAIHVRLLGCFTGVEHLGGQIFVTFSDFWWSVTRASPKSPKYAFQSPSNKFPEWRRHKICLRSLLGVQERGVNKRSTERAQRESLREHPIDSLFIFRNRDWHSITITILEKMICLCRALANKPSRDWTSKMVSRLLYLIQGHWRVMFGSLSKYKPYYNIVYCYRNGKYYLVAAELIFRVRETASPKSAAAFSVSSSWKSFSMIGTGIAKEFTPLAARLVTCCTSLMLATSSLMSLWTPVTIFCTHPRDPSWNFQRQL